MSECSQASGSVQKDSVSFSSSLFNIPFFTLRARKLGIFSSCPFVGIPFVSNARTTSSKVLLFGGLKNPSLIRFAKARLARPPHVVGP